MKIPLAIAALFLLIRPVDGEVIRYPRGLARGEHYRLAFVTSIERDATSGDVDDYNRFVQAVADAAPEVGSWGLQWKAITSTAEVSAIDNTETTFSDAEFGLPIYRVDGVRLAPDYRLFWSSGSFEAITSPNFNVTELGSSLPPNDRFGVLVFTGSEDNGSPAVSSALGADLGAVVGRADGGSTAWISGAGSRFVQDAAHLYAISEVLTVPEPSHALVELALLFVAAILLRGGRSKRFIAS